MTAILATLISVLQPVIMSLAAWGLSAFRGWIASKTSNQQVLSVIDQVNAAATAAVQAGFGALQGLVGPQQQAAAVLKMVADAKAHLGPNGIAALKQVKGFANDDQVNAFLYTEVNSAIHAVSQAAIQSINVATPPNSIVQN